MIFEYEDGGVLDEWEFVLGGSSEKVRVNGRFVTEDGRAMIELALAGYGIVLQEERVIALAASGRLSRVLPTHHVPARPLNIVYSTAASMSPTLRAFIDAVTASLA